MTEYILFVIECTNFCPRTGLVPKKEFIEARQSDYEILKSNAVKYNGIDQVLFQNIIWTGRTGRHEKTEWGHVISDIRMYIEARQGRLGRSGGS